MASGRQRTCAGIPSSHLYFPDTRLPLSFPSPGHSAQLRLSVKENAEYMLVKDMAATPAAGASAAAAAGAQRSGQDAEKMSSSALLLQDKTAAGNPPGKVDSGNGSSSTAVVATQGGSRGTHIMPRRFGGGSSVCSLVGGVGSCGHFFAPND
jgi:hypothetical protein